MLFQRMVAFPPILLFPKLPKAPKRDNQERDNQGKDNQERGNRVKDNQDRGNQGKGNQDRVP